MLPEEDGPTGGLELYKKSKKCTDTNQATSQKSWQTISYTVEKYQPVNFAKKDFLDTLITKNRTKRAVLNP